MSGLRGPGPIETAVILLVGVATVLVVILIAAAAGLAFGGPQILLQVALGAGVMLAIVCLAVSTLR